MQCLFLVTDKQPETNSVAQQLLITAISVESFYTLSSTINNTLYQQHWAIDFKTGIKYALHFTRGKSTRITNYSAT